MIEFVYGRKGSGKTKKMLSAANQTMEECSGSVAYIDNNDNHILDLNKDIRFINASEYEVHSAEGFYGFICGIMAQDFDLEVLYIDGFLKIVPIEIFALQAFFEKLAKVAKRMNVRVVMTMSFEQPELPSFFHTYTLLPVS